MVDRPADGIVARRPDDAAVLARAPAPVAPAPWLDIGVVLGAVRRHGWTLIACIIVTPLLMLIALHQMTPRYTATAIVIYNPSEFAPRELQSILRVDPTTDAVMASQTEIVRSLPTAERVADRFNLYTSPEFNWRLRRPSLPARGRAALASLWNGVRGLHSPPAEPSAESIHRAVMQAVQAAIVVRTVKATRLMEVSFTTQDQTLAAPAANLVSEIYISSQLDAKFAAVRHASGWLQRRVAELRGEVQTAEDRIAAYRAREGLVQGVQAGLNTEQISRLNADLLQARNEVAQAQGRLDVARGRTGAAAQAALSPSVVQLRAQEDQLTAQLQAMLTRLSGGHPDVESLRKRLASVRAAVAAEIGRVVSASEAEVRSGRARVAALERSLAEAQTQVEHDATAQIPLNAMQRDAEASRTLLQAVLERIQQTAQQTAIELPDARVISPALPPGEPSFPKTKLLLGAAVVAGLCFGLLLVWLLELADSTFRSGEDVRERLGLPCFALIPQVPARILGRARIEEYGAHKPLSPFAEQLRALRAGLWLRSRPPKIVAITAARPGEGKTTIAMALARSAAINGERVLVVDCDIRQPSLAKLLHAEGKAGLSDCLLGHATLDDIIQTDSVTTARFIASGSAEANTAGLFMSDAMGQALERLRAEHDLILLDAPPALAMTDARLLGRIADATLLCVRWRDTPLRVVRNALGLLEEASAHVAGVALTRVNAKTHVRAGFADSEIYHPRYGGYFRE